MCLQECVRVCVCRIKQMIAHKQNEEQQQKQQQSFALKAEAAAEAATPTKAEPRGRGTGSGSRERPAGLQRAPSRFLALCRSASVFDYVSVAATKQKINK